MTFTVITAWLIYSSKGDYLLRSKMHDRIKASNIEEASIIALIKTLGINPSISCIWRNWP